MRGKDIPKTDFQTTYDNYEFLVMSFVLINGPTTFMDLMNKVFREYLDSIVIVFINDMFLNSKE